MTSHGWHNTNFIPATEPFLVYMLDPADISTSTRTERVIGWLVDHQYGDSNLAVPTDSRVIAATLQVDAGEVIPVDSSSLEFIGVYPEGSSRALSRLRPSGKTGLSTVCDPG